MHFLKPVKTMPDTNLENARSVTNNFISFAPNIHVKLGKINEICGPAWIRIAILIEAKTTGLVVWVSPNWEDFIINTDNISEWFSPSRLLFVNAKNKND